MQRENLSPKCDKQNTALSQIWDKTKHGLRDWIISHLGLGNLWFGERSKTFGFEFSISWCSLFKWEEKKKFGSSL